MQHCVIKPNAIDMREDICIGWFKYATCRLQSHTRAHTHPYNFIQLSPKVFFDNPMQITDRQTDDRLIALHIFHTPPCMYSSLQDYLHQPARHPAVSGYGIRK